MAEVLPTDVLPLPMSGPGSLDDWSSKIEASKQAIKQTRERFHWRTHTERYVGKGLTTVPDRDTVLLPKDYAYTEQKKPLLFFQLPEVVLTPARPDVTVDTAQLFQAVLNELVGPDQLNCAATISEVLSDILVPAGIGLLKIGYESFVDPQQPTVTVEVAPAQRDPVTGAEIAPAQTAEVPNIVRERYFSERVSPVDFLFDTSFRGSDWSKVAWMGHRFRIAPPVAAQLWGLDPEETQRLARRGTDRTPSPDDSLAPDLTVQQLGGLEATEIYYRAMEVDPQVGDPDLWRVLVLLEGHERPVVHRTSPFQQVDGARVVGGLRRPPIYPLTLRYVSDSPLPPSDCHMSRVIVDELSRGRTQMLQQRDRNVPMRGIDISKVSPDSRDKILQGHVQELIPFDGVNPGEQPLFGMPQSAYPNENFNFNTIGERDLQEAWALASQNLGIQSQSARTATEISLQQSGTDTRMAAEQTKVLLWWVSVVQGLASLVQQFGPDSPQFTQVLGQDGAQRLVAWTRQEIAGEFAFTIRPDSARRVDQAAERKFRLDAMNLMINIPGINQPELIRWAAPALGLDPDKILAPPPPPPPPEPPRFTISVKGEDLSPLSPQFPNVQAVLASRGVQISPTAPAGPPGTVGPEGPPPGPIQAGPRVPPVNQHLADRTGQLPGAGRRTAQPS